MQDYHNDQPPPTYRSQARYRQIPDNRREDVSRPSAVIPPRAFAEYPPRSYPPRSYPPRSYPPQSYPPQSRPPQSHPLQSCPPPSYPPQSFANTNPSTLKPGQFKPCVVPQTSRIIRGKAYQPFARAYMPALAEYGISSSDFLAFIDALNEVWLAHPYIQATGMAGGMLGVVPLVEFQVASLGIALAAEYSANKVSQLRTKAYLKVANEQLFGPKGFHVQVLTTSKMMAEIGMPGTELELPPLPPADASGQSSADASRQSSRDGSGQPPADATGQPSVSEPLRRRIEALKDYIQPITFDEQSFAASSDNWLKKVAEKQEQFFAKRQTRRLTAVREKGLKKIAEAEQTERGAEEYISQIEYLIAMARAEAAQKMSGPEGQTEKGREKINKELDKELEKLEAKMKQHLEAQKKQAASKRRDGTKKIEKVDQKEQKIAQKIMWVVVTRDHLSESK